ncbi:hypothetical protein Bbelb_266710 [Branchiostoma belcheri]|nr:hypothetical protein Bbelb_266710 [Branchiostoma belcheri]
MFPIADFYYSVFSLQKSLVETSLHQAFLRDPTEVQMLEFGKKRGRIKKVSPMEGSLDRRLPPTEGSRHFLTPTTASHSDTPGQGAAMDTTNLNKIREELLSCGICLETFTDPRVLPCQHTFCQKCISQISADKRIFRCPTCREQVILPKNGVEGFKKNFELASFCEKLVAVKKRPPVAEKPRAGDKCGTHKKEVRRFYCQQCKVAICSECILDIHQGHSICSAAQAAGGSRDRIGGSLKTCKERIKIHEDVASGISDNEKKLEAEKKAVESTIRSYQQQLIDDINKTAAVLLQELESHFMTKQMRLIEQKDSAQSTLDEVSSTRDWAEKRLSFTEPEVIGMEDAICKKLEVAIAMKELSADYISLEMDFQPAISPTGKTLLGHLKEKGSENGRKDSLKRATPTPTPVMRGINPNQPVPGLVFFGHEGSGEGQLTEPRGMTVTPEGRIFVMDGCSDIEEGEIKEYDSAGQFVGKSFQPHYFQLAADGAGRLFCTRPQQETVDVLDKLGTCVQTFGKGQLSYPLGIAIHPVGGQILVTDTQRCKVFIYQPDGMLIRHFGSSGRGDHELTYPMGVAVDSAWNIYVSDHDCHCIKVFAMMGTFRLKIAKKGSKDGQLKNPKGICVDAEGNIIVADSGNGRVSMFDSHGKFSRHLLTSDQGLGHPSQVTLMPEGRLAVMDMETCRGLIFQYKSDQ